MTKGGIRPPAEMEIAGMDIPEMGALAYREFEMAIEASDQEIGQRLPVEAVAVLVEDGAHPRDRPEEVHRRRPRRPEVPSRGLEGVLERLGRGA